MRQYPSWYRLAALFLFVLWPSGVSAQDAAPQAPELRAFWVDGYNDGFLTATQCDQLLARVRAAHMNAVIVEVRKRADADYASHYEPWATNDPQHFDALAYLCKQAHAPGKPYIQVHAWVNVCSAGGNPSPQSLVSMHPDWLSLSDTGADYDGESTKIDPGNPAAADWTYRVCLDIVRHYPIDGLHLDAIRYGGVGKTLGHWGYNAASIARYNTRYGTLGQPAWNDPRWMQWRRDQVTALVRRISVAAHALKPHLIVSAATICWGDAPRNIPDYKAKSDAYTRVYADWLSWLRDGLLDLNCPMTYFDAAKPAQVTDWRRWARFIKDHQYGHLSTLGVGIYLNSISASLWQIASARQPTGQGNAAAGVALFSYASTDTQNGRIQQYRPAFYGALSSVFPVDVPPPPMPQLEHPKVGTISGMLLEGQDLQPVGSVAVSAKGRGKTFQAETDGNGFFAFVGILPGDYQLGFPVPSVQAKRFRKFLVGVGVTAKAMPLPLVLIPPVSGEANRGRSVAGVGRLKEGAGVIFSEALVTVGSDRLGTNFYIANGFGQPPLRISAPDLSPPTIKGDLVAVSGMLHHTSDGTVINAIAVRQVGAVLVKPPSSKPAL